jgi:7-carboxy-7-deazaguanine synthase
VSQDLKLYELYSSVQGEARYAGLPCVFVRMAGCPLRCSWCDTKYAYSGGETVSVDDLLGRVMETGLSYVELTGGEPLAQEASFALISRLCDAGKTVMIETSGAVDISGVDPRAHVIMDVKCPDSGMAERMLWENMQHIHPKDDVKFVLASRADYDYAVKTIRDHDLMSRCSVFLSTAFSLLHPREVVEWLLEDRLDVRLQLQMHKFIWPPDQRGV